MVTVKGRKVCLTGKEAKALKQGAKDVGLSPQTYFTGLLWEHIMRVARQGVFVNAQKNKGLVTSQVSSRRRP